MSELDDLPYDEHDGFTLGVKKAAAHIRQYGLGGKWKEPQFQKALDRDLAKRNVKITLPRLKFMGE